MIYQSKTTVYNTKLPWKNYNTPNQAPSSTKSFPIRCIPIWKPLIYSVICLHRADKTKVSRLESQHQTNYKRALKPTRIPAPPLSVHKRENKKVIRNLHVASERFVGIAHIESNQPTPLIGGNQ